MFLVQGEIDAREDSFRNTAEAGQRLLEADHYAADDVKEKVNCGLNDQHLAIYYLISADLIMREKKIDLCRHFVSCHVTDVQRVVILINVLLVFGSQCYGWWWPGDTRSQGISMCNIDVSDNDLSSALEGFSIYLALNVFTGESLCYSGNIVLFCANLCFTTLLFACLAVCLCDENIILTDLDTDGLVQERRNSSVLAMELRLSCTNPSIQSPYWQWASTFGFVSFNKREGLWGKFIWPGTACLFWQSTAKHVAEFW